jgi:hypothetical protein
MDNDTSMFLDLSTVDRLAIPSEESCVKPKRKVETEKGKKAESKPGRLGDRSTSRT